MPNKPFCRLYKQFPNSEQKETIQHFLTLFFWMLYRYKIGCIGIPCTPGFNSIFIHCPACLPGRRRLIIESESLTKLAMIVIILLTGYTLKKHSANSIHGSFHYFLSLFLFYSRKECRKAFDILEAGKIPKKD